MRYEGSAESRRDGCFGARRIRLARASAVPPGLRCLRLAPSPEVLGYCHVSLRDIRIGCGALTFLSATELREAFGVCGACSRFRIACALRQRQQAGRTPNASRQAFSMRLRDSTVVLPRRWDCVCTELQHQETHERGYDQG